MIDADGNTETSIVDRSTLTVGCRSSGQGTMLSGNKQILSSVINHLSSLTFLLKNFFTFSPFHRKLAAETIESIYPYHSQYRFFLRFHSKQINQKF
jgi:hypothetical protein